MQTLKYLLQKGFTYMKRKKLIQFFIVFSKHFDAHSTANVSKDLKIVIFLFTMIYDFELL